MLGGSGILGFKGFRASGFSGLRVQSGAQELGVLRIRGWVSGLQPASETSSWAPVLLDPNRVRKALCLFWVARR